MCLSITLGNPLPALPFQLVGNTMRATTVQRAQASIRPALRCQIAAVLFTGPVFPEILR